MTKTPEKLENSSMFFRMGFSLTMLFVVLLCGTVLAAPQEQTGKSLFKSNCASCHGQNGSPTPVGKSLNAPDLSSAVQSKTAAELHDAIANGKGNMPPFKDKLSEAQINSLVTYIHTLSGQHK